MNRQHPRLFFDAQWLHWMRSGVSVILISCAFLFFAGPDADAQSGGITVTVEEVDVSALPTVTVRVSVRDNNGVPIQNLEAEHFEIAEDNAAVFEPSTVDAEANPEAQVSLCFVIDLFRTLEGKPIEAAQQATEELLIDLLDEPNDADRAAFVGVREGVSTDASEIDADYEVPFTNDRNEVLNVVNFLHERIQVSGPGTPLYDAVVKAIRMAKASEPVTHRAVIVMTDGDDRGSVNTDSDTIQQATNARTPVFSVGLSNSGLDEQYLMRLAENTGGIYQAAETPDDFSPLFSNVLSTLRTQYVLSYDSGFSEDGNAHSVIVQVRTPTGLEAFDEHRVTIPAGAVSGPESEAEEESEAESEEEAGSEAASEAGSEAGSEEEVQDEPEPTSEPATSEPETGAVEPAEDDWIATARDWVEDNVLLAGLAVGALALFLIALIIVVVIVVRNRRSTVRQPVAPPEVPSYPPDSEPGFELEPRGATAAADDSPGFGGGGTAPGPPPTMMDREGGLGPEPSHGFEAPPPVGQEFAEPSFQPHVEDRTRVLGQRTQMSTVGLLIDREHPEHRLDVAKPVVTIGRAEGRDARVEHNTVSRQHAVIKLEEGQFRLYDLGSTNGTFVGDERVHEPVTLDDGAIVRFGDKAFVFKLIALDT